MLLRALVPARAAGYHDALQAYLSKIFPTVLLICNLGASVCCVLAGDYRRATYWAASALCIGAITF